MKKNKKEFSTTYIYKTDKKYEGENVYYFLENEYDYSSRTFRYIIREGRLLINDKEAMFIDILKEGDLIKVSFPVEEPDAPSTDMKIDIIYEDDDIAVINKKPGMVVHVTKSHPLDTLQNAIYHKWEIENKHFKTRFVNRLDMDTSGIVVIAKNKYVHHFIQNQSINNQIDKKYVLIVEGIMDKKEGYINAPIKRAEGHPLRRIVAEDGKECITKYKVIEQFKNHSLVEAKLITGRTHQLRVHFSYVGHPILGDSLYNENKSELISHQALHAKSISFVHPRGNKPMTFEAELFDDFKDVLGILKKS